jgi:hypothetical protein
LKKYLKGASFVDFQKTYPIEKEEEMKKDINEIRNYWVNQGKEVELKVKDETNKDGKQ